jgi:hypothetical protein
LNSPPVLITALNNLPARWRPPRVP